MTSVRGDRADIEETFWDVVELLSAVTPASDAVIVFHIGIHSPYGEHSRVSEIRGWGNFQNLVHVAPALDAFIIDDTGVIHARSNQSRISDRARNFGLAKIIDPPALDSFVIDCAGMVGPHGDGSGVKERWDVIRFILILAPTMHSCVVQGASAISVRSYCAWIGEIGNGILSLLLEAPAPYAL